MLQAPSPQGRREPGEVVRAGQNDRPGRAPGRTRRRLRRTRAAHPDGPRDPVVADRPDRRPAGDGHRPRAGGPPQADPATRTFQVKVGITDPPEAMRLGATVTGRVTLGGAPRYGGPGKRADRGERASPAVWVVDPQSQTVALRNVDVAAIRPDQRRGLAGARNRRRRGHRRGAGAAPGPEGALARRRVMSRFNLSEWAIRHRSLVIYFMLVLIVAGVWPPIAARAQARTRTSRSRPWWCRPAGRAPRSTTRSSRSPTASSASSRRRRTSTTCGATRPPARPRSSST